MRAAEKAKTQEDTTEDHLIGREKSVVGKWERERERQGGGKVERHERDSKREKTGDHEEEDLQQSYSVDIESTAWSEQHL